MRVEELTQRYAKGERNFLKVDLFGENFSNLDLSGIKSANLILKDISFMETRLKTAVGADLSAINRGSI